jgi:tetratricopeptide (TPR) repeat protein
MPAEDMDIARKALALTLAGIGERKARGAETDGEAALLNLLEEKETRYRDALAQGDLPRAERCAPRPWPPAAQLCGGPGKSVVFHLSSHAELCRRLQWNDKAEVAANEALAMAGQLGLDDSWRRGPTNTLALLHAAAGRADEAEALYKKTIAMAIAEARAAPATAWCAPSTTWRSCMPSRARTTRPSFATPARWCTWTSSARRRTAKDQGDAELHSHMLNNFAGLLMARRDFDGARPLYERSLAIQQRSCRGISTAAANAHNDLGLMAQERRRPAPGAGAFPAHAAAQPDLHARPFQQHRERAAQHRQREHGAGPGRARRAHGAQHMSIGGRSMRWTATGCARW